MVAPVIEPEFEPPRSRIPTTNFFSPTDTTLGQVPQVIEADNPVLYRELLDLHDAIEALQLQTDRTIEDVAQESTRLIRNTLVTDAYTVQSTDGTIRVDASAGDITVTLLSVATIIGSRYDIKRIDLVPANKVILLGDGSELIDDRAAGIRISTKSSYTVKANATGWDII